MRNPSAHLQEKDGPQPVALKGIVKLAKQGERKSRQETNNARRKHE
jgi:hypothetical protein